jgi:ceramide glucosyltransferase
MRPEPLQSAETSNGSKVQYYVALGSLIWWVIVWSVCGIGFTQL